MRIRRVRVLQYVLALLWAGPVPVSAQPPPSAAEVYKSVSDSVVWVEVRDEQAKPVSQASAFVVGSGLLLTNAHAVQGQSVWIRLGAVTVPATVERVDVVNDLALLRVDAELSAPPLEFADAEPTAGAHVFALGNPRGLERTISDGLVSGIRVVENRSLLQISAAISPGSSGGPVLNERGEVVGVAVGMFRDAQSLSFAVPAKIAAAFVRNEPDSIGASGLDLIEALIDERNREEWSNKPESNYQKLTLKLRDTLTEALPSSHDGKRLLLLFARIRFSLDGTRQLIAERAVQVLPKSSVAHANLAATLENSAIFENDDQERQALYKRAEKEATQALMYATETERRERLLLLGGIQVSLPDRRELGQVSLRQAVGTFRDEISQSAALQLHSVNSELKKFSEAKKWFEFAESIGPVEPYYYPDHAAMLEEAGDNGGAARAYIIAGGGGQYRHLCSAARVLSDLPDQLDAAIARARECLEAASKATNGDRSAAYAHRLLSVFLARRGVIDQAIGEARQAIAIDGTDGLAFGLLASSLLTAERWTEAENAARTAIRLTDGAYANHHFDLGSALFEQKRWSEAKSSFEQAARMDPKDSAATYNVALALVRLGFEKDSVYWWEETLRRNPTIREADEIRARIQRIRSK